MGSRRTFIRRIAASALFTSQISQRGLGRSTQTRPIHMQIATRAKALGRGKFTKIAVLYPKGCLANLLPIKSAFAEQTGIEIILIEASLDEISSEMILAKRTTALTQSSDVALPPTFAIPDLVESGVIADLTAFATEYEPNAFRNTYLYSLGDTFQNKLYGYQADGDAYLLFLRKSWLENQRHQEAFHKRFGLPLQIPRNWTELDRQMEFFHAPHDGKFGGSLFRNRNYALWEFWIRFHSKFILPFTDEMQPNIAHPEVVESLEEMKAASRFLEGGSQENGLFENFRSFANGDKYCNLGWGGTQKYLNGPKSKIKDDLIVAPTPGAIVHGQHISVPYFNWGWNYVVSANSAQKELAYLFCLFANSPTISTRAVREAGGYFDPYRAEHYLDPEIIKTYGSEFLKAHYHSMRNAIPDLYIRGQGIYRDALKQAVYIACLDHVPPKKALESVAKKWDRITNRLGRKEQIKQWQALKKSYPKAFAGKH